jgi:alpha-L-arabinofuranosidase
LRTIDAPQGARGRRPRFGSIPYLDVSAAWNEEKEEIAVFVVNRHEREEVELLLTAGGFGTAEVLEHVGLQSVDPLASNTRENAGAVVPRGLATAKAERESIRAKIPAFSWNMLRLKA